MKDKVSPAQVKAALLEPAALDKGITILPFLFVYCVLCSSSSVTLAQIQIFDSGETWLPAS